MEDELRSVARRDFLKQMGIMGMGVGAMSVLAACSPKTGLANEDGSTETPSASLEWTSKTPEELHALGGNTMSLYTLNQLRHEYIATRGDYTMEDGTVIPAVWNKLLALFNTYGMGTGNVINDSRFTWFMKNMTEDDAEGYLQMPYGQLFTALDFADASGRDAAECEAMCQRLFEKAILWHSQREGINYYHHQAIAHGLYEENLDRFTEPGFLADFMPLLQYDYSYEGNINLGTPVYYTIPCSKDVVADEEGVLALDDWEQLVDRHTVFSVSPCQCRMPAILGTGEVPPALFSEELKEYRSPICNHYLETCLAFGEQARYYIDRKIGREIDKNEALRILKRNIDDGMVPQSAYSKETEVICSCHGDCCGILATYVALGVEAFGQSSCRSTVSHYELQYDKETCIKCGACAKRCTMFAITMDAEGYPSVNDMCVRCGQCGLVCPQHARTLTAKPASERIELPTTLLEDHNLKAAWRFDEGTIL